MSKKDLLKIILFWFFTSFLILGTIIFLLGAITFFILFLVGIFYEVTKLKMIFIIVTLCGYPIGLFGTPSFLFLLYSKKIRKHIKLDSWIK